MSNMDDKNIDNNYNSWTMHKDDFTGFSSDIIRFHRRLSDVAQLIIITAVLST